MKRVSSPLVGKQNDYNTLTSGPNLVEFNTCEEPKQKRWSSFFLTLIIIHWLKKTNGWYHNHSCNTLMKDSVFNSVTIKWLRTAFLIFFSSKVMNNKFDLIPK